MASTQLSEPHITPTAPTPGPPQDPAARKGSAVRKVAVVLVIAAVIGGAVWKIRSNAKTEATTTTRSNAALADRPQPVLVATVAQKTMPIYLTALGTVTPYYSVTIKSRVDGQLMTVNVREGQAVRKGQLLAEIDPRPYEAALAQAQGQLVKDQATAENAKAEAQRYTALLEAVHGKFGQPCPRCGEKIQRIRYADNETDYCARCQTGGKVLADRGLSRLLGSDWPRTLDELEALKRR